MATLAVRVVGRDKKIRACFLFLPAPGRCMFVYFVIFMPIGLFVFSRENCSLAPWRVPSCVVVAHLESAEVRRSKSIMRLFFLFTCGRGLAGLAATLCLLFERSAGGSSLAVLFVLMTA